MAVQKQKRLSNKELEKLLSEMRLWPKHQLAVIAELVMHMRWQKHQLEFFEEKLHEYEQANFFKEVVKANIPLREEPPSTKYPLPIRLQHMIDAGMRGSDEWLRTLKWNNIHESTVDELIKTYKGVDS